ncbi:phosphatidylglycerophosphatase B [Dickeya lacustris]|uniref:undecaprenyl-diphosphate phosphatase n=2 Tax=Dickeya lacustris TaxID=2259638 RepID=A0ABY8G903_9GAMM|nr:phosphatidylglycerophosphatase B [Dickeya lacustris]WFN56438.1 phosphatidylglycerophosphatase B [Dickeya lacustris]
MQDLTKRTLIGTMSLMVLPLWVWATGWQWQPTVTGWWLKPLFWMTETVSAPWGIATSVLLAGVTVWLLRLRGRQAMSAVVILLATIVAGQGIKAVMKHWTQEPRPFVVWLEQTNQIAVSDFYALSNNARAALLAHQLPPSTAIPSWQRQHWQQQADYAFPSGHTLFAASWALVMAGLLWPRRHYTATVLILLWANSVIGSRLLLGMHWPQDVAVAALISAVLALIAGWLLQRVCSIPATPR